MLGESKCQLRGPSPLPLFPPLLFFSLFRRRRRFSLNSRSSHVSPRDKETDLRARAHALRILDRCSESFLDISGYSSSIRKPSSPVRARMKRVHL